MKKFIKDLADELEECPFCKRYNLDPDYDIDKAIEIWNDRKGKP